MQPSHVVQRLNMEPGTRYILVRGSPSFNGTIYEIVGEAISFPTFYKQVVYRAVSGSMAGQLYVCGYFDFAYKFEREKKPIPVESVAEIKPQVPQVKNPHKSMLEGSGH